MADRASRPSSVRTSANGGGGRGAGSSMMTTAGSSSTKKATTTTTTTTTTVDAKGFALAMAGARRELLQAGEAAGLAPETGDLIGVVCRYVTRSVERALFAPEAVAEAELRLALGRVQDAVRECESHYSCSVLVRALEGRLNARLDGLAEHIANTARGAVDAARREYGSGGGDGGGSCCCGRHHRHEEDHHVHRDDNSHDDDIRSDEGGEVEESRGRDDDDERLDLLDQLRTAHHLLSTKDAEIDRLRAALADCMASITPQNTPSAVLSDERGDSWPSRTRPSPASSSSQTASEAVVDDDAEEDMARPTQAQLLHDMALLKATQEKQELQLQQRQQQQQRLAKAEAAARAHEEELQEARREAEEQAQMAAARAEQQVAEAEERVRAECAAAAAAAQQQAASAASAALAATQEQLERSLEANGRLFTSLCDLRPNIRVMARVRPALGASEAELDELPARPGATSSCLQRLGVPEKASVMAGVRGDAPTFETFDFERVFGAADTNADVVAAVEPLVGHAIGGRHVCVFAYGQTGTGKSHTMGAADGVIPSAFALLASWIAARRGAWDYVVEATFVEIYAENCYDLLRGDDDGDGRGGRAPEKVAVRFDSRRNRATGKVEKFYFAESRRVELTRDGALDDERVQWTLDRAARNRRVRATQKNSESSRSHSLLALYIRGTSKTEMTEGVLNLIDLAGSERFHVAGAASAEAQAEAIAINKSLSALQKVLGDMANPKATRTSLRESTLTKLLEPCLGDDAKCLMLVMVSPLLKDREETRNTLRFAKGAQQVKLRTIKSTAEFGASASSSASAQPSPGKAPPTVARPSGSARKPAAASSSSTPSASNRSTPATREFSPRSFRERVANGQGPGNLPLPPFSPVSSAPAKPTPGRSNAQRQGKSSTRADRDE